MNVADQQTLLRWAREAITRGPPVVREEELTPGLREPRAAFVTLTAAGELRGCIGYLQHDRPAWQNVVRAAVAAATEDSRFEPVTPVELPGLRISISLLDPPVELPAVAQFEPLRHGIIVERGSHRALLLPKVAQERGWDTGQVLAAVCGKAGLPPTAWREPGTRLHVFETEDFAEPE